MGKIYSTHLLRKSIYNRTVTSYDNLQIHSFHPALLPPPPFPFFILPHLFPLSTILRTPSATSSLTRCAILFPSMIFDLSPGIICKYSLSGSRTVEYQPPWCTLGSRKFAVLSRPDLGRGNRAFCRKTWGSLVAITEHCGRIK